MGKKNFAEWKCRTKWRKENNEFIKIAGPAVAKAK
jgi:hypothetical protein